MTVSRSLRIGRVFVRTLAWVVAAALLVLALAVLAIESSWGKDRLRQLVMSQAERVLTGTLEIDRLSGSLLRGVRLDGVRLVQDGVPVVTISEATVSYRPLALFQGGTTIHHLELQGLRVVGAKGPDGRWNLATLVRSRPSRPPGAQPGRPLVLETIVLHDARVEFRDALALGPIRVPTTFTDLNGTIRFERRAPAWALTFTDLAWHGGAPDLSVERLDGRLSNSGSDWGFEQMQVVTPRSSFRVDGAIERPAATPASPPPSSRLRFDVDAERFAFQEWGGLLPGLRNIAIEAAFRLRLSGPSNELTTDITLESNGGRIASGLALDATVPGWHARGRADVERLNLAPWLNRPDRPSDITGQVDFDLDLDLGRHFPRGRYAFNGSHAAYMGYAADDLVARGELLATEARIDEATATAYGANVRIAAGGIGIDAPYRYRFTGRAEGVDLRRLPRDVPVPHVESALVLDFDVSGRFANGYLVGGATFGPSEFLGARIGAGAVGRIDSSATPFAYAGEGDISDVSLHRFGEGLDVAWMRDPRYEGTVSGRFHVTGSGSDAATMTLDGGGRLSEARLFGGRLRDAEVGVEIADGSLSGRYAGRFDDIHLAQAFADARVDAVLSGAGRAAIRVDGLLVRTVTLEDYTIEGQTDLHSSTAGGIDISRGTFDARLAGARAHVTRLDLEGPAFEGTGSGDLVFEEGGSSRFDFDLARVDLGRLAPDGPVSSGLLSATGRMTGDLQRPRVNGTGRVSRVTAGNIDVLSGQFDYDATIPIDDPHEATVRFSGNASPLTVGSQVLSEVSFAGSYDRHAMALDLRGTRAGGSTPGIDAALVARGRLDVRARTVELDTLDATVQGVPWHLARGTTARMRWRDEGVTVDALALADRDTGRQRIAITGDWGATPGATLHVTANGVYLDTFSGAMSSPARYGGRLDADAYIRRAGSDTTIVTGLFTITDGRIRRLPFDRLLATVTYDDGRLKVDARLDQAPGAWLTAVGTVPLSLFVEGQPDLPMQLAIASSPIDLGLIEGVTDVVRNVSGRLTINLTAAGSGRDPHFEGGIDLANAAFSVRATGARYRNGRLAARLTRDRVDVTALHVEDGEGHTLDVTGSLGTHELKVGDLAVDAQARDFEVLRNEFGTTRVDATLHLQGQFESPRLTGTLAITGGELNVDEILDRVLMRPYATEAAAEAPAEEELDALQALNPWERLGLDIAVNSRGTLRMVGSNVQVSSGTPLGLGNVNVRAYGEVYLYKDPADQLFVTGSLDSLVGTYAFQGRRFELDPSSSIVFRGDLNPELYVTVTREISGVQARVSIIGPLSEPELRLSSTPQLDDSNILSLIVFNANINDLSALQQQELAVRAGTLAAGFLATPLVTALERSLGLDILEIETGAVAGGTPKVTIGDEIAPGLVARFSRQFGQQEYNEASLEYYLSRLFRIRATFSDAGATMARSTFRRVERAGIDLLVFFSF